jgi:hypothetical protein
MRTKNTKLLRALFGWTLCLCLLGIVLPVGAAEPSNWLLALAEEEAAEAAPEPMEEAADDGGMPFSFSLDYTLVSDYVWRGANFSEFAAEGREKLNHQIGAGIELDLGDAGAVGFGWWGEIYAANKSGRNPNRSDKYHQEADYTVYYGYSFEDIGVDVEVGWIAYVFPPASGDGHTSYEVYGSLGFNDGPLFGMEDGVLNPSIAYYYDIDLVEAGWLEIGFSHEFAVVENVTVTPSITFGVDNEYWDNAIGNTGHESTKLTTMVYGVEVGYDLSAALAMSEEYGSLSLAGFVTFSDAVRADRAIGLNDEIFGGVTVSYGW